MKTSVVILAAAALCGLVSIGLSQSKSSGSGWVSPEISLVQQATALVGDDRFEEAWQLITRPDAREEGRSLAASSRIGWRVASVAGALRNRSDYAAADAFARFALLKAWTEPGRSLSRGDLADAGYWCAWLAAEILSDRTSALVWIEQAEWADPKSKRIRDLKEKLAEAERSFPTR